MANRPQRVRDEERVTVDSRDYTEAQIHQFIPRKLYKYSAVSKYFLLGLENHSLWFSSPLDFNDPFDCKVRLNFGRTKRAVMQNFDKMFPKERAAAGLDLEALYKTFIEKPHAFEEILNLGNHYAFGELMGVCCFSENNDHILMWSHYAANHSGVCLQFNSGRKGLVHNNVLPVNYYKDYPKINLSEYRAEDLRTFYYHAICAKSDNWDYEFEWRAIQAGGVKQSRAYSPEDLTGIIFGVNTTKRDFKKIDRIVQENNWLHIQYYKAEMSPKAYRLRIRKM